MAQYQKGELIGVDTGNIYAGVKPRFGNNEKFKAALLKLLLKERLRWNDELKIYRAKVYNTKQAKLVLKAMKSVSPEDAADLEGTVVDESVFEDANSCDMALMPLEVDGQMMGAVGGCTYPWGDELKERGFKFHHAIDGAVANVWTAPINTVDFDELEALFEEYGFPTTKYDGVAEDSDEEGEEGGE